MKATFTVTKKGTWAYIQKSVRKDGKSTTITVKKLGLLSRIQEQTGCADARQWVIDLARKMTEDEKAGRAVIDIPFHSGREIALGSKSFKTGGGLLLSRLYNDLGLPSLCEDILAGSRARYNLDEILKTLVLGRILFPGSKSRTLEKSRDMLFPPKFREEEMFRALSLISGHSDRIQAVVFKNSDRIVKRRDRVIYYDCTNYYFEIEENDSDRIMTDTGEFIPGLRKRGKSKEHRPNPIVQMGMFMDMDGIPLAFVIFPGNESEQTSLRPLEEKLNRHFGMTEYVVSTDCGLASEDNRRYNMKILEQEERLDDSCTDILKIRSLHHEIEHLFRTTKTHLDARPVYLSRQDRIKSHFLICFLSMVLLKILQRQITEAYPQDYAQTPLSIDSLIETLRDFNFASLPQGNYQPVFRRTALTDRIQSILGINANYEIISPQKMRGIHRKVNRR